MQLRIKQFEKLAKRKGYRDGKQLIIRLGAGKKAYECMKHGSYIGYELVKKIYNVFGEEETLKVVDFERETIDGFKSKYVKVGTKLY